MEAISQARKAGGRIVAVGTTSVRTLETAAKAGKDSIISYSGPTNLYILPGYRFKLVDAMITNFHLPKSTLIMLVSAFAGRETILHAYEIAMQEHYRFYSFGDAMLILLMDWQTGLNTQRTVVLVGQDHFAHLSAVVDQVWDLAWIIHGDGLFQVHLEATEIQIPEEGIHQVDLLVVRQKP